MVGVSASEPAVAESRPAVAERRGGGRSSYLEERFLAVGAASLELAAGAAPVLSACGGESDGPEVGEGQEIATVADLAPGSAVAFTEADTGRPCVLVRLEGEDLVAYLAECAHQGCTVFYKTDDSGDGYLACSCHNSIFEPTEGGRVVSRPADEPLQKVPIEVRDRKIFRA